MPVKSSVSCFQVLRLPPFEPKCAPCSYQHYSAPGTLEVISARSNIFSTPNFPAFQSHSAERTRNRSKQACLARTETIARLRHPDATVSRRRRFDESASGTSGTFDSHSAYRHARVLSGRLGRRRRGRVGQPLAIDGRVEPSSIATRNRPAVWTFEVIGIGSEGNRNGTDEYSPASGTSEGRRVRERRTCDSMASTSMREPHVSNSSQCDQLSDDRSGPARRVDRDMSSECPSCDVLMFRAARRDAAGAGYSHVRAHTHEHGFRIWIFL